MADTQTRPKSQRDLVRERALLAHEETGLYVDADELLRFGEFRKECIAKLPISGIEWVGQPRLWPLTSFTYCALAAAAIYYLLAGKPGVWGSWTASSIAWLFLCGSYQARWRTRVRVRCHGKNFSFPADEQSFGASGFTASLRILVRDHASGRLVERRAFARPLEAATEVEKGASVSHASPILRHTLSRIYLLESELVRLDREHGAAVRIPLADIRAYRAVRSFEVSILGLLYLLLFWGISDSMEEFAVLSWTWWGLGFLFIMCAELFPRRGSRLHLDLDGRVIKLPLEMTWTQATAFTATLSATAATLLRSSITK